MNCKMTEKLIPKFIDNKLDEYELDEFVAHTDQCEQCKEELSIQFLVSVGMERLEEGGTFDLGGELALKLNNSRNRVIRTKKKNNFYLILELLFVLAVLVFAILFIY